MENYLRVTRKYQGTESAAKVAVDAAEFVRYLIGSRGRMEVDKKWGREVFYALTPELMDAARGHIKSPHVAKKIAEFALYENDKEGWILKPKNVLFAMESFSAGGYSSDFIVREIVKSVGGKSAFHTIEKYAKGVSPNKEEIKKLFPHFCENLYKELSALITSELIGDAIGEIRLSGKEYNKKDPHTGGSAYFDLKDLKEKIDNGEWEEEARTWFDMYGWKSKSRGNETHDPIDWYVKDANSSKSISGVNHLSSFIQDKQILPISVLLSDFEAEIGSAFETKAYLHRRNELDALKIEVSELQKQLIEELGLLEERLKHESDSGKTKPSKWLDEKKGK